jgi:ABC-type antimicrobial peptide transport system permease subunit
MYFPLAQWKYGPTKTADLIIETNAGQLIHEAQLRRAIAEADASSAVGKVRTIDQMIDESAASRYFQTMLMATFAAAALWISLSGLYAVIAYLVESRRREIVVRMAVGAAPSEIIRMIAGEGAMLGGIGCAIGVGGALALEGVLRQFLYGVSPGDPLVMGGAAVLLFVTAVLASLVPGARASRLGLATVLRGD